MNKALVLLSGGQDSTTCLFWAKKNFDKVEAIAFDYGQKHSIELDYASMNANMAQVNLKIVPIPDILGGSALTEHEKDINGKHELNEELPASFVPGRNMVFLAIAGAYAASKGIKNLVTGVCETDFSGYPDCRNGFIHQMYYAWNSALGVNPLRVDSPSDLYKIHTPLMKLTKAETWKLAKELSDFDGEDCFYWQQNRDTKRLYNVVEIVRQNTITDYNGSEDQHEWGRGNLDNPASVLRKKGYDEAKEKGWI